MYNYSPDATVQMLLIVKLASIARTEADPLVKWQPRHHFQSIWAQPLQLVFSPHPYPLNFTPNLSFGS